MTKKKKSKTEILIKYNNIIVYLKKKNSMTYIVNKNDMKVQCSSVY